MIDITLTYPMLVQLVSSGTGASKEEIDTISASNKMKYEMYFGIAEKAIVLTRC